jgi:hypothetical protein
VLHVMHWRAAISQRVVDTAKPATDSQPDDLGGALLANDPRTF